MEIAKLKLQEQQSTELPEQIELRKLENDRDDLSKTVEEQGERLEALR